MHYYIKINTPVGELTLVADQDNLVAILWPDDDPNRVKFEELIEQQSHSVLTNTAQQLLEYFAGTRKTFDIPLKPRGTEFQRQVWQALQTIPYGETTSYGELAKQIHRPKASRAVGAANGRNPISIVIPCHRVVGGNGKLVGFAGGLTTKQYLLTLEQN